MNAGISGRYLFFVNYMKSGEMIHLSDSNLRRRQIYLFIDYLWLGCILMQCPSIQIKEYALAVYDPLKFYNSHDYHVLQGSKI